MSRRARRFAAAGALLLTACGAGQVRIGDTVIPPPPGFRIERPPSDFVCFAPKDRDELGVSFCARELTRKGVLAGNTVAIDERDVDGETMEIRGLGSGGNAPFDIVYFIVETDELFLFGECSHPRRIDDLTERCAPFADTFARWVRGIV